MLWTATCFHMEIRYSEEFVFRFLEWVQTMRESTTYQAVLREGRDEGRIEAEGQLVVAPSGDQAVR